MKKNAILLTLIASAAILLTSCGNGNNPANTVTNNPAIEDITANTDGNTIKVRDFDEIEVGCAAEVIYVSGGGNPIVIVSTDDETRKNVIIEVHERKLYLGIKGNNSYDKLKFEVHGTSKLDDINISGAVTFANKGQLNPRELDVDCTGASSITLNNIACTELNIDCSGASKASATDISCDELELTSTGASSIEDAPVLVNSSSSQLMSVADAFDAPEQSMLSSVQAILFNVIDDAPVQSTSSSRGFN